MDARLAVVRARNRRRLAARIQADAALCRMPLTEWVALTRPERKRRLAAARNATRRTA